MTRAEEIEQIELTPEELNLAIKEAKRAKYHRLRNADYWAEREAEKPKPEKKTKTPKNNFTDANT